MNLLRHSQCRHILHRWHSVKKMKFKILRWHSLEEKRGILKKSTPQITLKRKFHSKCLLQRWHSIEEEFVYCWIVVSFWEPRIGAKIMFLSNWNVKCLFLANLYKKNNHGWTPKIRNLHNIWNLSDRHESKPSVWGIL